MLSTFDTSTVELRLLGIGECWCPECASIRPAVIPTCKTCKQFQESLPKIIRGGSYTGKSLNPNPGKPKCDKS